MPILKTVLIPDQRPNVLDAAQKQEVQQQLERILQSSAFRSSARCQQLLRYIVTKAIEGSYDLLKERVVGAQVFGRTASYDTGDDSIVRVRANDVRKRLAQYYDEAPGRNCEVRVHLPPGSYVPEFYFPSGAAVKEPAERVKNERAPERSKRSTRLWAAVAAGVVLLSCIAAAMYHRGTRTVTDRFWAPVVNSSETALFCLGYAQVFTLSHPFQQEYFRIHPPSGDPEPRAVQLNPKQVLHGADLVSVQGQFVGVGGAQSVQMLASLLAAKGKSSSLRIGNDLSFADLRTHPAILIGAFSNRWTLRMNRDLRFYFDEETGEEIRDRRRPGVRWRLERNADGRERVDYAIITRLLHSDSGQVVVDASGITQYGCRAAGELLANDALLRAALNKAPADWDKRNLQIVLRSKIVRTTAGPPEVLAVHVW